MRIAAAAMFIAATVLTSCGGGPTKTPSPTASVTAMLPASATRPPATSTPSSTATTAPAPPSPTAGAAVPTPTPPAAPPPEPTEPAPPPPPTEPPPATGTLTVVALNVAFDVTSLSAAAGPITINFENQDRAVAHNIHFFSKASNQSLGMTDIEPGPVTSSLSLGTLAPGAYFYKCDLHPTTMTGILTLS